jgi:catechol 2,3-dioxygenase-like lactoylglutathione lyase family enzyme
MGEIVEEEEIQWLSSLDSASSSSSSSSTTIPLLSLNHVSFVCKSVSKSVRFYEDVLGFVLIKRPSSFDFEGAWYALILTCFFFCFPFSLFFFDFLGLITCFLKNFWGVYAGNPEARSTCLLTFDGPSWLKIQ